MNTQSESQSIPVVIMCGGKGTRLREETEFKPKPMVEIGGYPILWHIMKIYAHHGYSKFILCLGYRGSAIKEYFLNHHLYTKDFHLDLFKNEHRVLNADDSENFSITFADTGEDTLTAERLLKVEKYLDGDEFMLTYGDGVSDVDLNALRDYHHQQCCAHGTVGTITGIHPKSKYGLVETNDNCMITQTAGSWFSQSPFCRIANRVRWWSNPSSKQAKKGRLRCMRTTDSGIAWTRTKTKRILNSCGTQNRAGKFGIIVNHILWNHF